MTARWLSAATVESRLDPTLKPTVRIDHRVPRDVVHIDTPRRIEAIDELLG
ncbi:MAG: hypothetical protein ACOYLU_11375 [Limisphaerales bacterium]